LAIIPAGGEVMIFIALLLSLSLLVLANLVARTTKWRVPKCVLMGVAFTFLAAFFDLPPTAILGIFVQSFVLCAMMPFFAGKQGLTVFFRVASTVVALLAFCLPIAVRINELQTARTMVPFTSLEERLPPSPRHSAKPLTAESIERLDRLEGHWTWRTHELKRIHESTAWEFINRPGFGYSRMKPLSSQDLVGTDPAPIPQSASSPQITSTSEETSSTGAWPDAEKLQEFHRGSIVDFVNRFGFGYVKDRRQVAGFKSHGFSQAPEPAKPLRLVSVELVGILRDEPVVYLSHNLPLMSELRQARTRPLDGFENAGLETLGRGEDLFVKPSANNLRILGAIRSTKQCIDCHGGERGDLLGAFSFVLR
jgi:hypothetical protein